MLPGPRHRRLTAMWILLTGNKEGRMGLMVFRVRPTPIRFPTSAFYTLVDNALLHSVPSVSCLWVGHTVLLNRNCKFKVRLTWAGLKCEWIDQPTFKGLKAVLKSCTSIDNSGILRCVASVKLRVEIVSGVQLRVP